MTTPAPKKFWLVTIQCMSCNRRAEKVIHKKDKEAFEAGCSQCKRSVALQAEHEDWWFECYGAMEAWVEDIERL